MVLYYVFIMRCIGRGRHGSQLDELITCCTECHTHANHEKGGKLYGLIPQEFHDNAGVAVMNQMRWLIYSGAKEIAPDLDIHLTYGAYTKAKRKFLGLGKKHTSMMLMQWVIFIH